MDYSNIALDNFDDYPIIYICVLVAFDYDKILFSFLISLGKLELWVMLDGLS